MSQPPHYKATPHTILTSAPLANKFITPTKVSLLSINIDRYLQDFVKSRISPDELFVRINAWGQQLFGLAPVDQATGYRQFWSVERLSLLPIRLLDDARFTQLDPIALAKALEDPEHHVLYLLGSDDARVIDAGCATGLGSEDDWREWVECHLENLERLKQISAPGGETLYTLAIACDFVGAWAVLERRSDPAAAATLAAHRQIWAILQTLRVRSRGFEARVFLLPRSIRHMFLAKLVKSGTVLLFMRLCAQGFERVLAVYQLNRANSTEREISGRLGPLIPFARASIRASKTFREMTSDDVPEVSGWLDELLAAMLVKVHGYCAAVDAKSKSAAKRSRSTPEAFGQGESDMPADKRRVAVANGAQTGHQLLYGNMSDAGLLAVSLFRLMQLRHSIVALHTGAAPWWAKKLCETEVPTEAELRTYKADVVDMLTEYLAAKRKGKENGVFEEAIDEATEFFAELRLHPDGARDGQPSSGPSVKQLWRIFHSTDPLRCAADYGAR